MSPSTLYVGLDIHKESIAIAHVSDANDADMHHLGSIGTRQSDIDKLICQLHSACLRRWGTSRSGFSRRTLTDLLRSRAVRHMKGYQTAALAPTAAANRAASAAAA